MPITMEELLTAPTTASLLRNTTAPPFGKKPVKQQVCCTVGLQSAAVIPWRSQFRGAISESPARLPAELLDLTSATTMTTTAVQEKVRQSGLETPTTGNIPGILVTSY